MLVIGIETSGLRGSVALVRDGRCLQTRWLDQAGRRHAQALVLELHQILAAHSLAPADVQAVAVSRGPGSFTGLRVGMVCAKVFAYATRCQFVAVDTFAVVAMNCPLELDDAWIVEDAQRGELFAARYRRREGGDWTRTTPLEVVVADDWLKSRPAGETITGRGLSRCDLTDVQARCLTTDDIITPQASNVALLGERLLGDEAASPDADFDCWTAVPVYIRRSAAEEQRDRVHGQ